MFFLPLGTSLTFLYFFFFGDGSWTWILAWAIKVSWVLGVFCIGEVINVNFFFFFFWVFFVILFGLLWYSGSWVFLLFFTFFSFLFLFFSLGDLCFGLVSWGGVFFAIGNVINVPLLFFL